MTNPVQEPINLADQTESVASETNFQAYQKDKLVGMPITTADKIILSSHHVEYLCKFMWNQPNIWPREKMNIPRYNFINESIVALYQLLLDSLVQLL